MGEKYPNKFIFYYLENLIHVVLKNEHYHIFALMYKVIQKISSMTDIEYFEKFIFIISEIFESLQNIIEWHSGSRLKKMLNKIVDQKLSV